nr:hypothetical protein [Tanacetum cinerariifolium]
MLEKDMYDSWKSRMDLYMLNRHHGRMILELVEHGPLLWPTVKEDGVTRLKKYSELSAAKAIQADYDIDYAPTVHQHSGLSSPETGLVVSVFQKGDDPIDAINHMMSFLTAAVTSRYPATNNQLRTSSNPRQQATINNRRVTIQPIHGRQNSMPAGLSRPFASGPGGASEKQRVIVCYNCKGKGHMSKKCTKPKRKRDAEWFKDKNSNLPALQDDLILSVIKQLKTQVVNCTMINQDNKQVNELLTAELERYKNQERVLKEQKNDDKASVSYEQSLETKTLKHTLSDHLKEKESLEQKITLLKNDFQKEESRNIDKELALEKQVKELSNIALGYQNPCYLKRAQQLKQKLYDGSVIEKSEAIVIHDSEETLLLAEESFKND